MRNEKKYLLLLILLGLLYAFTSCNDKKNSVVGRWKMGDLSVDVKTSDSIATTIIKDSFMNNWESNRQDNVLVFEFSEDGRVITREEINVTYSYSLSRNKLTMTAENRTEVYDFTLKEDTLFLSTDLANVYDKDLKKAMGVDENIEVEKVFTAVKFIKDNK